MNPLHSLAQLISGLFQPHQQAMAAGTPDATPDPFVAKGAIKIGPNHYYVPSASNPTPPDQGGNPIPAPTNLPAQQPTNLAGNFAPVDMESVRKGIAARYGADNPILSNLDLYMKAGQQLSSQNQGMDPLLPIILALRETQGGKDLLNPNNTKLGKNNVFNIRNDTGAFQNYPDLQTAIMGNLQSGGDSGGLVGLLGGEKPQSKYIYEDFRKDPSNLSALFNHWSPTTDNNGDMNTQVNNYKWIRDHITNSELPANQY